MKEEPSYPKTEAGLKKGGSAKDSSAYSEKSSVAGGAARKGAPLDKQGMVSKKDEPIYKDACKDQ